jgi:hypothetical protein
MDKLKPCPFCGCKTEQHSDNDMIKIRCSNYDCQASSIHWYGDIEDAIGKWNKRADEATEINGSTSDGYHTFDELYFHRMILFSVICNQNSNKAWKSRKHSDGGMFGDDWFIVGIKTPLGEYSYHYKMDCWEYFNVEILPFAPEWDGHQPSDVTRLRSLISESEDTN